MCFKFISLNILFFSSIFFCSCQNSHENFEQLYFNVNANLLNPVFLDSSYGFSFSPPRGWNAVTPEILDKIKQKIKKEVPFPGGAPYHIIQVFSDSLHMNFCILSACTFPPKISLLKEKISLIDQQVREKFSKYPLQQGKIRLDRWKVLQYRILTEHQVLFKLFFLDLSNQWVQLDYAIARSSYSQTIESIESSLGSIHSTKREKGGVE